MLTLFDCFFFLFLNYYLCIKEPFHYQVENIATDLTDYKGQPIYSWAGGGRDDGGVYGEFSPIFFKTSRFYCIDSGVRWLSPTPHQPKSKGWDARYTSIYIYLK